MRRAALWTGAPPAAPAPIPALFTSAETDGALGELAHWPGYAPTPLYRLDGPAASLALDTIWYKDEGQRFGIGSFKPMGGGFAVARLLGRVLQGDAVAPLGIAALLDPACRRRAEAITVACATDGNHGRAVAWAAGAFGARAVVFLASHVSPRREAAIRAFGADVVRTTGSHDDAVREAAVRAHEHGWYVISETESASSERIALDVLLGYATIVAEATRQVSEPPTHIVVPAGVGGLAAAVLLEAQARWSPAPRVVVVEPASADAVHRSLRAGCRQTIEGPFPTIMGGLAAGEVSTFAWSVLSRGLDASVSLHDAPIGETMVALARPVPGDPVIEAGESGVAGLAALREVAADPACRAQLGLGDRSRVLVIGTEGATDRELYDQIVGQSATDPGPGRPAH